MRPRGDISKAMLEAAREPGTVVEVANRAQVGLSYARYTASRMIDRGDLVVLSADRPAVIVSAAAIAARHAPHDEDDDDSVVVVLNLAALWR